MDTIEEYFMERISTHLWVLEDYQMDVNKQWNDDGTPRGKISLIACKDTLKTAKNYMKMLNKYQKMKQINKIAKDKIGLKIHKTK